ncbi:hypothetical protein [Leucobacter sp. G161]|uniref:hypothetical protein n=1 Tax=Leucobacter sp. G161 TaxID=663704 RepID=UPI00073CCA64|nr:hypothetical protein [Leucobacter sp. G161]KUF05532.1 hypothetical protein AUL38_04040 [Leucobacter sp. G161]
MCQFNERCPSTKHRPGTRCPVEVRNRNREDKLIAQLWGLVIMVAVFGIGLGVYWLYYRAGASGLGFAPLDDIFFNSSEGLLNQPATSSVHGAIPR